jgi:hypothetical protein
MFRIIYLSTATHLLPTSEIESILRVSRKNNMKNDITGILLYSEGNLLQVLEGKKNPVLELYKKIATDNRHKSIIEVYAGEISKRYFPNWQMGYSYIENSFLDKNEDINIFKKQNDDDLDKMVEIFITTFLASHREKIKIK